MTDRTRTWGGVARRLGMGAALAASIGGSVGALAQTDDAAQAAQPSPTMQPPVRASEVGHSTRTWLDLQGSNAQAAPALPMLGAEAGLAYRRYMESFKSKIPDLYGSMLNTTGSGGGSGGATGGGAN
ncbi:DUF3613 domain-containing protein [Paraburkholderia bryophila]|uniref:DUF3613 domain-containing protein n=1 Tax=Paraburkholderia bryophila TaxID=420952 RepID=UPI00234B4122|nr:DUF3613 domain-containing protein [Paraburkholderia bryophila]WCM21241.1 DUF3613 domain-containing protein [Paraburkholderia bryophila]